ncbi:12323_t:CDS:10 [Entrophospora sp. SA101]|nr:12323_t:CDS:10 [Entrophospora sp. SA101]
MESDNDDKDSNQLRNKKSTVSYGNKEGLGKDDGDEQFDDCDATLAKELEADPKTIDDLKQESLGTSQENSNDHPDQDDPNQNKNLSNDLSHKNKSYEKSHSTIDSQKATSQKEFSSYFDFGKVTKLYRIQASTIQYLLQFVPDNFSRDNPCQLYQQVQILSEEMQVSYSRIICQICLDMLKNTRKNWGREHIKSILLFLKQYKWDKRKFLDALDNISKSTDLNLSKAFPDILEYCFKTFTIKDSEILKICNQWFDQNLDIVKKNKASDFNEVKFITIVFNNLSELYPTIGERIKIFNSLLDRAVERTIQCSENSVFKATCSIAKFPEQIYTRYFHVVKETLEKSSISPNQQLIQKIREICGCNKGEKFNIPNELCENIICFIMTKLQDRNTLNSDSEYYISIFKSKDFWIMIFNATGSIEYLNSHELVLQYRNSIIELAELISDRTINFLLLKKLIAVDSDENFVKLDKFFNAANYNKKSDSITITLDSAVFITRTILEDVKNEIKKYENKMDYLDTFYLGLSQNERIVDTQSYIDDLENKKKFLSKLTLKDILLPDYWAFHKKISQSAESVYQFRTSQSFKNIFEFCLQKNESSTLTVETIASIIIPNTFTDYEQTCKTYEDWKGISCSKACEFWKDVKDIELELGLMKNFLKLPKEKKFYDTIQCLSQIPVYKEKLANLDQVIKFFQDSHDKESQVTHVYKYLCSGDLLLEKLTKFFNSLDKKLKEMDNEKCWSLIKELMDAEVLVDFLRLIKEHDIKNLINSVDDHSDEKLIQEDAVSSFIEVKQFITPLLNIDVEKSLDDFLEEIGNIIKANPNLATKVVLCNNNCRALKNMYDNISNKGEVTKEKIKNAVMKGSYIFKRDTKEDKCSAILTYTSDKEAQNLSYTFNDLQDLRGRAILLAKPAVNLNLSLVSALEDVENFKHSMDEFVEQVDIAQDIINISSNLIQIGHFEFRKFKVAVKGTDKMKELLKEYKEKLREWKNIVNKAQEKHYYLTFFPGRHILTFYDYFSNVNSHNVIEESRILIRFVNRKAKLPSNKEFLGISFKKNDYYEILCEIGRKLQHIFEVFPKKNRQIKNIDNCIMTDVVLNGKLFVAACNEKSRVPNIIMSLYANHKSHPEPWQLLICTPLTTSEELIIFIKRCFFAANNGLMCKQEENYLLALICCREHGMHHHILDQFSQDVYGTNGLNTESMKAIFHELCPNVVSVSSDLSGQGKTEYIIQDSYKKRKIVHSLLISDSLDFRKLVNQLKECKLRQIESLHLNIVSADNPTEVNMFLFELLTLGIVSNSIDIAILPITEIYIEVASTTGQHLLNSLPITSYFKRVHLSWNIQNLVISQEINSPIQIVCHYLNAFDHNALDEIDILFKTNKKITAPLRANVCRELITKYYFNQDADDISSFRFIEVFVNVFADQLVRFSSSQFFQVGNLKQMVKEKGIRSTLFKTLLEVSKDFATRSIKTKAAQLESIKIKGTQSELINISNFEIAKLSTIIRWDDSNHLLVFFMSQSPDSICALYRDKTMVPNNVKMLLKSQSFGQNHDGWELDDYNKLNPKILLEKLEGLARKTLHDITYPNYALSADNLIKMALILLRARANIPVIMCGEAGCGKTSLIAFLAKAVEVDFKALNLHAGVQEETIINFVKDAQQKTVKGEVWLFFDEINTCNHIGLLSDLIAHRILEGRPIHPNIRLFSACNPYRIRTKSLSDAGLKTKVKIYEEQSRLVYQVKPLPDQILDYVWDYGVLQPNDEKKYIEIMLQDQNLPQELLRDHKILTETLFASQEFIRNIEEPYSVSLRDVKRAIKLVIFFYEHLKDRPARKKLPHEKNNPAKYPKSKPSLHVRSYILALGLCYHSRLYEKELRNKYKEEIAKIYNKYDKSFKKETFDLILREEQEDNIKRMICPPNTAFNEALLENVLVMMVCILTKIPAFIIGSPGSSKSLAIRLVSQNLRGADSNDPYFRKLPQVYLIPHQGSSSSTSEGILKVFEKANKYQETSRDEFPVISVVLLDEVGLAETSPFNPLKVLHSLLEPSYPADGRKVSVIGISNWRLDNSKSSRALLVQRPKFDLDDLIDTALHLLQNKKIKSATLRPLAQAYSKYEQDGQILPNFHGLRDYYALVKSLSSKNLTPDNIQMTLARNFGGTGEHKKLCEDYFGEVLNAFNNHQHRSYKSIPVLDLIRENLDDKDARHLMVIGKSESIVNILNYELRQRQLDPVIILGSQFPEDQDDYSYNILNRIMARSLYDLWNQNYIVMGSNDNPKYYTRVALGAYANPMLSVHKDFRCILVFEEKNLQYADPPLLNRFEKQKLVIDDILTQKENEIIAELNAWVKKFSTVSESNVQSCNRFNQQDLFIGFDSNETIQSLVINIIRTYPNANNLTILEKCKECLVAIATSDGMIRSENSLLSREEVLKWKEYYFKVQHHNSLFDYFNALLKQNVPNTEGKQIIVNTFSNINTDVESCLSNKISCQVDKLSTFKSEIQFQNRIKHFWLESDKQMLILQCDITTVNAGCIKLAKFVIEQFRGEFLAKRQNIPMKHTCIILHIHRKQEQPFVSFNFMCGWEQVTIDTLQIQDRNLSSLLEKPIIDIINTTYPFEEILKRELLWCLSCMKYYSSQKSLDHIKFLNLQIPNNEILVKYLECRTQQWLETNSETNWQYKVASNKMLLFPYSSFSGALQAYLRTIVRSQIAKLLFAIEKLSATKTLFLIDGLKKDEDEEEMEQFQNLLEFWTECFMDPKIVNTVEIPDLKPNGYNMPFINYDLEFPFSYYFMKRIDSFKQLFEDEINKLGENAENIDPQTGELYQHCFDEYTEGFSTIVLNSIPLLKKLSSLNQYPPHLYIDDFITVVSSNDSAGNRKPEIFRFLLQNHMGKNKILNPVFLHAYWWRNANTVLAEFQLIQISPMVIDKIAECDNSESFEYLLVNKIAAIMLRKINELQNLEQNLSIVKEWQRDVTKVLSLGAKILKGQSLPSLQILRICNDFVSTKSIPLSNIKEIIALGKGSIGQETLSTELIEKVFDILYQVEPTEKTLISKRSFLLRCLDIIKLESSFRPHFYNKIFSQGPFPLMGVIIQRIFLEEDKDKEESIFLTILENPSLARLNIINTCLNKQGLDSMMSTLCCDIIQTLFATYAYELSDLAEYFGSAARAIINPKTESLQKITAIALLKEFVIKFWDECIQEQSCSQPIKLESMDVDFEGLINEINNFMSMPLELIYSLKIYFIRVLRKRHNFSLNDVKIFCNRQSNTLPWLASIPWEDKSQSRLSFNPYWVLDVYSEAENGFSNCFLFKNKAPIRTFLQSLSKNKSIEHRIAFGGLLIHRMHLVRASEEWNSEYENISKDFMTEINGMNTLSPPYQNIIGNILENKQPFLQLNTNVTYEHLLIKSVIGHIVILHSSIPADSSPLTVYLNSLENCHAHFLLTLPTDNVSVIMNAITSKEKITSTCPQCKNAIGGERYEIAPGNQKLDVNPIINATIVNQPGYVEDQIETGIGHTVRSMQPNAYRILHLMVHALIGSSNNAKNFLKKITNNVEEYCFRHIENDWNVLKKIFNCNDENLALLLHLILTELTKKIPDGASLIKTPAQRDEWEMQFSKNYVEPSTKIFNKSIANFYRELNEASKKANGNDSLIESEINQTIEMDKNYMMKHLPRLWRTIGTINFESFRAYYFADQFKNSKTYPVLFVFFKHSEKLTQIKHLFSIIKFVEIMTSRLEYRISRQKAREMTFRNFINNESNGGVIQETYKMLEDAFNEFSLAWNAVSEQVKIYRCEEFKSGIPKINLDCPIVFGLVEEKDTGIYICAIINYLVRLQNDFLQEIMVTPSESLKFLEEPSSQVNVKSTLSQSNDHNNPLTTNRNCVQSLRINLNLDIGYGDDVIYDLQKIELELARWLIFGKAYIETIPNSHLYLEPFSYHMELFQGSMRILGEIKNIIPQEPIPIEKISLIKEEAEHLNKISFTSSRRVLDDPSDILSSLEVLLCFVKLNAVGQGDMLIQNYVTQWVKLSPLIMKPGFAKVLNAGLTLKHIVALYEFVEEQVADRLIGYINNMYKEELTTVQKDEISSLKRFMFRFLSAESNDYSKHPLKTYLSDEDLNYWSSGIDETTIDLLPDTWLNSHTFAIYEYYAQKEAEKKETWLFFDEINTCNHIGLLSDLIAHRMLEGKQIHPNIRLFSACNPYRFRTKSVSDAGLQTKVGIYDEKNRLVYQVKPLPDQILDYVWDYGVLQPEDEKKYIHIMLQDQLPKELLNHQVLTELLFASQQFIRKVEEPYSVSLRDVKRAIKLIKFFYEHLKDRPIRKRYPGEKEKPVKYPQVGKGKPSLLMRSYILALGLCYHSRLYEKELQEQEDNIKRMICPPNTAFNEALLENVLVMIVCMLTKIPVFIIGSPGSSKSLAVRLVSQNLRGADSNDPYFKKLPQVYLIPHQGSTSSTSEGILKVFEKANKYQDTSRKEFPVISVVLLDEVGLAETSPFNPLKVLHSELEPSYPADGPKVSVIGISNWRLDNSKSSRALLVQRFVVLYFI